jgi:GT2 family glycosyltransferase
MKISIIIPTYNRSQMLCKTLANIISFEHQYYELIMVDQTKEHDPQTKRYLDILISEKKIKYIHVDYPNLPNARNIGIKESSGDIVLFFDDDVEINNDTIPAHVSGFSKQNVGCVTGKVTIKNTDKRGNKVLEKNVIIKNIIKSILFLFLRKKAAYVGYLGILSNFTGKKILYSETSIGCNMSFRKDLFNICGLFDVKFSGNAVREDTDFSVRLRRYGYKILYIPNASVIHYMNNTGGTRAASNEAYWFSVFKNQCYFYLKNFHYSRLTIMFIHIFDFLRCRHQGLKFMPVFLKAYRAALIETKSK